MAINPHHKIEELNGVRCSIVETKLTEERASYITRILESNGYEVVSLKNDEGFVTLGVTDVMFNMLHSLYSRSLKTADGKLLTPAIWNNKFQEEGFYWNY